MGAYTAALTDIYQIIRLNLAFVDSNATLMQLHPDQVINALCAAGNA